MNSTRVEYPATSSSSDPHAIHPSDFRYHYLDNLRALAMMLGVFFHASFAYLPMSAEIWAVADVNKSLGLEAAALFSHLFRMPLFMVVAGFFAHYLFTRRGMKGFIKNRSVRVLAPALIFLPLVLASIIGVIVYAAYTTENKSPMLLFIMSSFSDGKGMEGPFSTLHLWFLFNLVWFYLAAVFLIKYFPISLNQWFLQRSSAITKIALLCGLPLLLMPSLYVQVGSVSMAPDRIYPQLWSFGYYGIYFAFGWLVFLNQQLLGAIARYWKLLLLVSVLAYAFAFTFYPRELSIDEMLNPDSYSVEPVKRWLLTVLHAFISAYMVFVCLIVGKKFLNTRNKTFRYFAESSYWVYLIHPPLVLYIQVILMDKHWNLWVEFLISSLGALAISVLSYQVLVRYTPIGWMLNGRRKKVAAAEQETI